MECLFEDQKLIIPALPPKGQLDFFEENLFRDQESISSIPEASQRTSGYNLIFHPLDRRRDPTYPPDTPQSPQPSWSTMQSE
ncbi:hypothetical protein CEXT_412531 [Caerostris extrusa]|uniref:Uncharacterized protein n=1 Tax=Caerostris extrusa TaxID=172846 RepID=A0AAV4U878_CAEEX|nr:hypothetical protein CEXT_412531 [Caerostris extrusa]